MPSCRPPLVAAALGLPLLATAQDDPPRNGYDVDIDLVRPLYTTDILPGMDVPENERPGTIRWGVTTQYTNNPLVLYELDTQVGPVVANRVSGWAGMSVDFTRALTGRFSIPIHFQWGTQVPRYAADGFAVGDANLGLHVAFLRRSTVGLGVYADVALPTSRRDFYAGERTPRLNAGFSLLANAGHFRWVTNLGVNARFRGVATTEDWGVGQELVFHNGFRYAILPRQLDVGLSVYSRFGFNNFFGAAESTGEALITARYQLPAIGLYEIGLTLSGGRGFTLGYGSSDARILFQLDFAKLRPPEPEDPGFADAQNNGNTTDPGLQFNVRDIGQIAGPQPDEPEWEVGELARVESQRIIIREAIRFKVNSAELLPESYPTLDFIADLLNKDARIAHVVIEGHASEDGDFDKNFYLSQQRAASIWQRLVLMGVHPTRLSIRGMGEVQPADATETYDTLQASRRVVFHIVRQYEAWETPPTYKLDLKYPWNGEPYQAIQPTIPAEGDEVLQEELKQRPKPQDDDLKGVDFDDKDDEDDEPAAPTPDENEELP
ncbi:MAG TPA: OmpA family protein [Myxococcota bacterium]|nr:OmpA family protein [Myxococcota bacterium]